MEPEVAERFERVETTVLDLARFVAQHVEASDARMTRIEVNLMKLSDALGSFALSVNEFVETSNVRMTRIEDNIGRHEQNMGRIEQNIGRLEQSMTRMEQDLGALIRAITAERGNGQSKG